MSLSTFAPLKIGVFRALWLAVLASNIGLWMELVGAQWLLVREPNAALLVSLVQVADNLPDAVFGLAGGVLADIFDRRNLQIVTQAFMTVIATGLAVVTFATHIPPGVLLAFTFVLGAGSVIALPAFQSLVPDIVPRAEISSAANLSAILTNIARAAGPAVAGLLIVRSGVATVFAVNAAANLYYCLVVLGWRPGKSLTPEAGEPFLSALRAGERYVKYSPAVKRLLLRTGLFLLPASALWALLAVVAVQRLHQGADAYGVMLAALGVGAVAGGIVLPLLQARLSANLLTLIAGVVYAAALAGVVLVPSLPLVLLLLLPAGMAWLITLTDVLACLQLFLPSWVRARGLAMFQVVVFGGQAVGAFLWGVCAGSLGIVPTFLVAAAVMLVGSATVWVWPFPNTKGADRSQVQPWSAPELVIDPASTTGPVMVTTTYNISSDREGHFRDVMEHVRGARQRTGAFEWTLYQDGETAHRFVEVYLVDTWEEYQRQQNERLTGSDWATLQQASGLSDPAPKSTHLLGVDVAREQLP